MLCLHEYLIWSFLFYSFPVLKLHYPHRRSSPHPGIRDYFPLDPISCPLSLKSFSLNLSSSWAVGRVCPRPSCPRVKRHFSSVEGGGLKEKKGELVTSLKRVNKFLRWARPNSRTQGEEGTLIWQIPPRIQPQNEGGKLDGAQELQWGCLKHTPVWGPWCPISPVQTGHYAEMVIWLASPLSFPLSSSPLKQLVL